MMTGKQELALSLVQAAHGNWKRAHDDWFMERHNLQQAIRHAAKLGVSQTAIAERLGWPRQRVNKLLTK